MLLLWVVPQCFGYHPLVVPQCMDLLGYCYSVQTCWTGSATVYRLAWVLLQCTGLLMSKLINCIMSCRQLKQRSGSHLSQPFDVTKLQELLGALPSWLAGIGGATEELGWLNTLLAQVRTWQHQQRASDQGVLGVLPILPVMSAQAYVICMLYI